ncbi:MAG: hypothetical protein ACN6OP_15200 [Pseudomonadales bacterium]
MELAACSGCLVGVGPSTFGVVGFDGPTGAPFSVTFTPAGSSPEGVVCIARPLAAFCSGAGSGNGTAAAALTAGGRLAGGVVAAGAGGTGGNFADS